MTTTKITIFFLLLATIFYLFVAQSENDESKQVTQQQIYKQQSKTPNPVLSQTAHSSEPQDKVLELENLWEKKSQQVEQLQSLPMSKLLNLFKLALKQHDDTQLNLIESLLIDQAQNDPSIAEYIETLLAEGSSEAYHLVWLLAEMATPESLNALMNYAQSQTDDKTAALSRTLDSIANIGKHRDKNGKIKIDLATVLSERLDQPELDPSFFKAVSQGLGSVGDEQSVQKLLNLASDNLDDPEIQTAVESALLKVRNANGVGPMANFMNTDLNFEKTLTSKVGNALAAMGKPEATQALLEFAGQLESEQHNQQLIDWTKKIRDSRSIQMILESSDKFPFKNDNLLKQIQRQVEIVKQGQSVEQK